MLDNDNDNTSSRKAAVTLPPPVAHDVDMRTLLTQRGRKAAASPPAYDRTASNSLSDNWSAESATRHITHVTGHVRGPAADDRLALAR
jgi:hypothetical protein